MLATGKRVRIYQCTSFFWVYGTMGSTCSKMCELIKCILPSCSYSSLFMLSSSSSVHWPCQWRKWLPTMLNKIIMWVPEQKSTAPAIVFGFCFDNLLILQDKIKIFMAKYYCVRLHSLIGAALAAGLLAARHMARYLLTWIHWTWNFDSLRIKIQVIMHAFESMIFVVFPFN